MMVNNEADRAKWACCICSEASCHGSTLSIKTLNGCQLHEVDEVVVKIYSQHVSIDLIVMC